MAKDKKSVLVYADWITTFEELEDDEAGRLIKHFFRYINDQDPEPPDRLTKLVFENIKAQLKRDLIKRGAGMYHWNWKDGKTPRNLEIRNCLSMKQWRISVFERDNYICQSCFNKGGTLQAHHIKYFSKYPLLRFSLDNGITLCKKCHLRIHKKQ